MSSAPKVMVSSTFYDLRQIRADLTRFVVDELGYVPLLSELPSFPVIPDLDTIENCRARVEQDADILVLVIGGRYGSIDDKSNTSVTNLEFLAARQKGIPVYSFVEKRVLALLPIWKSNAAADFSSAVDTPRLFEFVEHVRTQERVWTFPFETAQDIVGVLRRQFAYLFHDALQVRLRLSGAELPPYLTSLGAKALRIALEKPRAWEYRLFLQSWIECVEQRRPQIKEYRSALTLGSAELVAADAAMDWVQTRLHELQSFVASANHLLGASVQDAFGPPGQPGNAEDIVWVAQMLTAVLDGLLTWAKRIRCARLQSPWEAIGRQLALFVDDLVSQFQTFPVDSLRRVEEAMAAATTQTPQVVQMTMFFRLSNLEGFEQEIAAIRQRFGV
jgi:hypothetical protein